MTLSIEETKRCKYLREVMEHNWQIEKQYNTYQLWFGVAALILILAGGILIYSNLQTTGIVTEAGGVITGIVFVTFNRLADAARKRRKTAYKEWDAAGCGDDENESNKLLRLLGL